MEKRRTISKRVKDQDKSHTSEWGSNQIPQGILKLNNYVFLTTDIYFVNKKPLLITLSRKIDFTTTSHLPTQKYREIFKAF